MMKTQKNKVYVVLWGYKTVYEPTQIDSIWSTKAAANARKKLMQYDNRGTSLYAEVSEMLLDSENPYAE